MLHAEFRMQRVFVISILGLVACTSQREPVDAGPILHATRPALSEPGSTDASDLCDLSLETARALVIERHPDILLALTTMQRADARLLDAAAAFRPTLELSGTGTLNDEAVAFDMPGAGSFTIRPRWQQQWNASLGYSLFAFGRDQATRASRHAERAATELERRAIMAQLTEDVTVAWHRVHAAAGHVGVAEETLRLADKQVADATALVEAGQRTRDTLLTAAVDLLARRQDLVVANNALVHAKRVLNTLLVRSLDSAVELAPQPASQPALPALADLLAQAERDNPTLLALRKRREGLRHARDAVKAGSLPELSLALSARHDGTPTFGSPATSGDLSLALRWLIVDGGRRAAEIAALHADAVGLDARERSEILRLHSELSRAHLDHEEAHSAQDLARQGALAAEENHRIVQERVRAGVLTSREELEARRALAEARHQITEATFRMASAAARVERLSAAAPPPQP
jgi:outer membrane protein TolC